MRDGYGLGGGGGKCEVVDFIADFAGEVEECPFGGVEGVLEMSGFGLRVCGHCGRNFCI